MSQDPRPFGEPRRKPTRADRKRRAERARKENERTQALARQQAPQPGAPPGAPLPTLPGIAPATPWSAPGAPEPAPVQSRKMRQDRQARVPRWWWLIAPLLLMTAATLLWTTQASPALTGTWNPWWFAGTTLAATLAGIWAWKWYVTVDRRVPGRVILALMLLLVVSALWGSRATVVIDSTAYPQWSTEAQIDSYSRELYADMLRIAQADELLAQDAVTARVRFDEYRPVHDEMLAISAKWDERLSGGLPTEQLAGIVDNTRAAAYWAADGLTAKEEWVITSDAQLAARVTQRREEVTSLVLSAGAALRELTALYGITLDPGAESEVVE